MNRVQAHLRLSAPSSASHFHHSSIDAVTMDLLETKLGIAALWAIAVQSSGSCASQIDSLKELLHICGDRSVEDFLAEFSISPVPELCGLLIPNFTAAASEQRVALCEVQYLVTHLLHRLYTNDGGKELWVHLKERPPVLASLLHVLEDVEVRIPSVYSYMSTHVSFAMFDWVSYRQLR